MERVKRNGRGKEKGEERGGGGREKNQLIAGR